MYLIVHLFINCEMECGSYFTVIIVCYCSFACTDCIMDFSYEYKSPMIFQIGDFINITKLLF